MTTVGNLRSQHFMDYTVIGDTVNLGSRLEGLNKVYGTSIIVGESTAQGLDSDFVLRELDRARVKGKGKPVRIFELAGFRDEVDEALLLRTEAFHAGLEQYRRREWERAQETFQQILEGKGDDGPSLLYLQRISQLLKNPPGPDWEAVASFSTK